MVGGGRFWGAEAAHNVQKKFVDSYARSIFQPQTKICLLW